MQSKEVKIAKYLCLAPGVFLIVSGLMLLFLPAAAVVLFDLHDVEMLKEPMSLSMGVRQLAIGLMITTLVFFNQIKALAFVMVIGAIVPLTDFFVFSPSVGMLSALRHAVSVPLILGLGLYLLSHQKNR